MVAPQVFQGMSGEVTDSAGILQYTEEVPRGKSALSVFILEHSARNGNGNAVVSKKYIAEQGRIMVTSTSEPVFLANSSSLLAITLIMPVHSSIPPKDRAQMIRETVHIMLISPPLVRSSSTMAWPV